MFLGDALNPSWAGKPLELSPADAENVSITGAYRLSRVRPLADTAGSDIAGRLTPQLRSRPWDRHPHAALWSAAPEDRVVAEAMTAANGGRW
jgi:hypothetical protein